MKRVLSLLLSILLLLFGCAPTRRVVGDYLRADIGIGVHHGHTAFADMVLTYPDAQAVIASLEQALTEITSAKDGERYIAAYEEHVKEFNALVGAASLAYVRYCQNVTDPNRAEEYGKLNSSLAVIQSQLIRLEIELMERWDYHAERGPEYAALLDRARQQNTPAIRSLRNREDELCRRYEQLNSEYRLTFKGRTWTMEELMTDETMSLQSFLEALEQYQTGKNQAAGSLFLELLSVRQQMAVESGFSSYAARQYAAFGREYSPEQAYDAAQVVKEVFVPLYMRLRERCENDLRYLSGASFTEDRFIAVMEKAAERAVPGAGEAWRYMLTYGLYDSVTSKKKLHGSFTTYLSNYDCPFVFTQWEDDASSVYTVIHEFGHFLSYYLNPEGTYYGPENLDLAETDAQGFELLMLDEYDALFGRYADAARLCFLMNGLYAILSGFMEDEFQQLAYRLKQPSVEKLNQLYAELSKAYGFDRLFGYEGREWTEIGHTFQFPFYYISYGVSMLGAMTLVQKGSKGYLRLLERNAGVSSSTIIGRDVLSEETIRDLAGWVEKAAEALLQE